MSDWGSKLENVTNVRETSDGQSREVNSKKGEELLNQLFADDFENPEQDERIESNGISSSIEVNSLFQDDYETESECSAEAYDDPEDYEERPEPGDLREPYKNYLENGEYESIDEMCNDLGLNEYDVYWTEDDFDDEEDVDEDEQFDLTSEFEPNTKFEVNDHFYETDDDGYIFKVDGKHLLPNNNYTINDFSYGTDNRGRICYCRGYPKDTPDGARDPAAQQFAGGEDREPGDQGGHIIARALGGSKGIENMVAMRGPINQGPYSFLQEREISRAIREGKEVYESINIDYDGESLRPSKIYVSYYYEDHVVDIDYDNVEGSTDLLEHSVKDCVDESSYADLKKEIEDANSDGGKISVIAVKTDYEGDRVIVVMRDDNSEKPSNEIRVLSMKSEEGDA